MQAKRLVSLTGLALALALLFLTSAVFMGNRFRYGETITNESTGQVQLLGNVGQ